MQVPPRSTVDASRAPRAATLRRIPSLDGIRAIAILMVMGLHTLQQANISPHGPFLALYTLFNGALGVSIFFVLSGYLITRLLLHEFHLRGSVNLRRFFAKRALRILPPVYVYLGVLTLLAAAGLLAFSRLDLLSSLFFFHDYVSRSSWAVGHLWSLAVEEQFYLLWPPLLLLCLHSHSQLGRNRAIWLCLVVIVCSPVIRVLSFRVQQPWIHHGSGFHMYADLLLFGGLAALAEGSAPFERIFRAATRFPMLPLLALGLASALEIRFQNYWELVLGRSCTGALSIVLILWCVRHPLSFAGRLLNSAPLTHLGVLSYSLYLWQTLFLTADNQQLFSHAAWLTRFPQSWLLVFLVAELSFRFVERPSLHLRDRLLRRFEYADRTPPLRPTTADPAPRTFSLLE